MSKVATTIPIMVMFVLACSSPSGVDQWELDEPEEPDEPDSEHDPNGNSNDVGDPSFDTAEDAVDEVTAHLPTVECPDSSDDLTGDQFAFHLYRAVACRRGEEENILLSPATARLALGEWAETADEVRADEFAQKLGYDDRAAMIAGGEEYRRELLDRQPRPFVLPLSDDRIKYGFEEENAERLQRALGIEFYEIRCSADVPTDCVWHPQSGRWTDKAFLDDEEASSIGDKRAPSTQGMVLRGQWERRKQVLSPHPGRLLFLTPSGDEIDTDYAYSRVANAFVAESFVLLQWRMLGGDISVLFVGGLQQPLGDIEDEFLSRSVKQWIEPFASPPDYRHERLAAPVLDSHDTVDVGSLLELEKSMETATTVSIARDGSHGSNLGINSPESLTRVVIDRERDSPRGPHMPDIEMPDDEEVEQRLFYFERPYLFVIYDHPTESILKMGRVSQL